MKITGKYCMMALLLIAAGCSKKNYPVGNYQPTAVNADGDLSDWSLPLRFGSSTGFVQYNITNDDDNIYVSMETQDEATAIKILRSGVELYIDASGGESKKTCLSFPIANSASAFPVGNMNKGNGKNGMIQALVMHDTSLSTTGFIHIADNTYNISDSKIKVAVKPTGNGGLSYEAIIPMRYVFESKPKQLSVGLVINEMKDMPAQAKSTGNTQRSSQGSYGAGGGGHRGGGGGGGSRGNYRGTNRNTSTSAEPVVHAVDRSALYKQDTNWYKFRLASKS